MTVDLSKIRPGDEITVRCLVLENDGTRDLPLHVRPANGDAYWPRRADIVSHAPKALSVGDRVRSVGWGATPLRVLCIHGRRAWLADAEDSAVSALLSDLERIP